MLPPGKRRDEPAWPCRAAARGSWPRPPAPRRRGDTRPRRFGCAHAKQRARQLVGAVLRGGWPGRHLLAIRINAVPVQPDGYVGGDAFHYARPRASRRSAMTASGCSTLTRSTRSTPRSRRARTSTTGPNGYSRLRARHVRASARRGHARRRDDRRGFA